VRSPTALELIEEIEDAAVIFGIYPDGGVVILEGESILKEIVDTNQAEKLRLLHVPLRTQREVGVIKAAIPLIRGGKMGKVEIDRLQRLLYRARQKRH
jgi:hypothetical protein